LKWDFHRTTFILHFPLLKEELFEQDDSCWHPNFKKQYII
jgi:hypothetical protein